MTPGDTCKISELKAGDVFEWENRLCQKGMVADRHGWFKVWDLKYHRVIKMQVHTGHKAAYHGRLTAEMVRKMMKSNA